MNIPKYFYFRVKAKNHGTAIEIEVEDASNEDVVEVVRCKDCKFFKGDGLECRWGLYAYEDDFCSNGERREANGNSD